jgi:hypothetical protein
LPVTNDDMAESSAVVYVTLTPLAVVICLK